MTTTRELLSKNFRVLPSDIPNDGILFVDHQKHGRSGHGGNCLTECINGDIVSFYSNVSGETYEGHGTAGWSEYRRSTDGGKTWGESVVLNFSKRACGSRYSARMRTGRASGESIKLRLR